jgi:hypothetical protein
MTVYGRILRLLLCCLLAGLPLLALGVSLYRCDKNGVIEFRQTSCQAGQEQHIQVINNSSGLTPSEPGLRLKKASEKTDRVSRKPSEASSDKGCWRKEQQLQRVERRLRAGYKASEYQRLHDRQREYEEYLRRFCR